MPGSYLQVSGMPDAFPQLLTFSHLQLSCNFKEYAWFLAEFQYENV